MEDKKFLIKFNATEVVSVMEAPESGIIAGTNFMVVNDLQLAKAGISSTGMDISKIDEYINIYI